MTQPDLFDQRKTRADQIFARFIEFHRENPNVWKLFERFAFEAIRSGFDHYSGNAVFQRMRWHTEVETRGGSLKLNDHYHTYYARLFHAAHPDHKGFFRNRTRKSEGQPAHGNDRQEFIDAPAGDEDDLNRKLLALLPRP